MCEISLLLPPSHGCHCAPPRVHLSAAVCKGSLDYLFLRCLFLLSFGAQAAPNVVNGENYTPLFLALELDDQIARNLLMVTFLPLCLRFLRRFLCNRRLAAIRAWASTIVLRRVQAFCAKCLFQVELEKHDFRLGALILTTVHSFAKTRNTAHISWVASAVAPSLDLSRTQLELVPQVRCCGVVFCFVLTQLSAEYVPAVVVITDGSVWLLARNASPFSVRSGVAAG
jgi:hypothetical protein